jgi:uncharacterized protein (DUF302 family)
MQMTTKQITVQRFSVTSTKPFREVVAAFEAAVGHPDTNLFRASIRAAKSRAELEKSVVAAVGPSELMEFTRFDLGEVLDKEQKAKAPQSVRFMVGNPVIMQCMVEHVPDAGSYAPVTILIDERPEGVRLSYDRMTSLISSYGNAAALKVAEGLDCKVETLLMASAA